MLASSPSRRARAELEPSRPRIIDLTSKRTCSLQLLAISGPQSKSSHIRNLIMTQSIVQHALIAVDETKAGEYYGTNRVRMGLGRRETSARRADPSRLFLPEPAALEGSARPESRTRARNSACSEECEPQSRAILRPECGFRTFVPVLPE